MALLTKREMAEYREIYIKSNEFKNNYRFKARKDMAHAFRYNAIT